MRTIKALLRMSRPYYAIQAIAPAAAGYVTAARGHFSWLELATVVAVFGLLSLATWTGNDFSDSSDDNRGRSKRFCGMYVAGGTRAAATKGLSQWKVVIFIVLLMALASALAATISVLFLLCSIASALIGVCYSLRPLRLKVRGICGAVVIACSYGLLAFLAGWIANGTQVPFSAIAFGAIMSALVFGYDGIGHLVDQADDNSNGLRTFVVRLGADRASKLLAICQVVPVVLFLVLEQSGYLNVNLVGLSFLFGVGALSAKILWFAAREQHLCAIRLMSVPIVSAAFFLMA